PALPERPPFVRDASVPLKADLDRGEPSPVVERDLRFERPQLLNVPNRRQPPPESLQVETIAKAARRQRASLCLELLVDQRDADRKGRAVEWRQCLGQSQTRIALSRGHRGRDQPAIFVDVAETDADIGHPPQRVEREMPGVTE